MAMSRSLAAYNDVAAVWNAACERGDLTLTLHSPSAAKNFQMRMYFYRKLLRTKQEQSFGPATHAKTPYDHMSLRIPKENPCQIRVMQVIFHGKIEDADGNPVDLQNIPMTAEPEDADPLDLGTFDAEDDLEAAARAFAKSLR
jgi:hypothetical protein